MSIYNFSPIASNSQNYPFITWNDGFSDEELKAIVDYCETIPKQDSFTDDGSINEEIRKSKIAWIENTQEISWLYDRLAYIAKKINSKFYNFDLTGFNEHFQYTVYHEENFGKYDWHLDLLSENADSSPRKLTLVLQLSDPEDYEGGELQTITGPFENSVDKKKGLVTAFPCWTLHRVTPVSKGTRKSLVIWISGPQFK